MSLLARDDGGETAVMAVRKPRKSALEGQDLRASQRVSCCIRSLYQRRGYSWTDPCAGHKTAQSTKSTTTPGFTMLASSSTSQLVSRTQPCEPALSISEGSGDP